MFSKSDDLGAQKRPAVDDVELMFGRELKHTKKVMPKGLKFKDPDYHKAPPAQQELIVL